MASTTDQQRQATPQGAIAWIAVGSEGYGILRAITTLATEMARRGHPTFIICFHEGAVAATARRLGIAVEVLNVGVPPTFHGGMLQKVPQLLKSAMVARRAIPRIVELLRKSSAIALRVVTPSLVAVAGKAAKAANAHSCWEMPNLVSDRYPFYINRRIYQRLCRKYRIGVAADSQFTGDTLRGRGVHPEVHYHATDHTVFDPQQVAPHHRDVLHIPAAADLFGMIARLVEAKGQSILIRALAEISQTHPSAHLLLVGGPLDSEYGRSLKPLAESLGVGDRVHFTGPVNDAERYYGMLDVAVSLRIDPEPFGLSVIEAMMMEKPVLVRALGGPAETVLDGITGWHVAGIGASDVAEGMRRALSQRDGWKKMGKAGRQRSIECFSAVSVADRYEAMLSRQQ